MKKITYLFVTMLMALTMVGCQVDLSDYLTREDAEKTYVTRTEYETKIAELEKKIENVDNKFANYLNVEDPTKIFTKAQIKEIIESYGYVTTSGLTEAQIKEIIESYGYVTTSGLTEAQINTIVQNYVNTVLVDYAKKSELEALGDISSAVSTYLATVDFSEYITEGYTKEEVNAKIKAITDITDKLGDVDTLLATISGLSTKVTSLETTVANIEAEGLTDTQIAQIKADLQTWCNENLNGATVDLTNYVKTTDLASYVKSETLDAYAKKSDIPTDYVSTTTFNAKVTEIESRITTVESLVTRVATLETNLTTLTTTVSNKADKSALDTLSEKYDVIKADYLKSADLVGYLTVESLGYSNASDVGKIAEKIADLDNRVKALEDLLTVDNQFGKVITNLNNSIKANADKLVGIDTTVKASLDSLSSTISSNKTELEGLITSKYSDINTIKADINTLKTKKVAYSDFADDVITNLDTLYKVDLTPYIKSAEITESYLKGIIGTYVTTSIKSATDTLKTDIASNYQLKGDYLTSESQTITNITSAISSLETTVNAIEIKVLRDEKNDFGLVYIKLNKCYLVSYSIEITKETTDDYIIKETCDNIATWEVVKNFEDITF